MNQTACLGQRFALLSLVLALAACSTLDNDKVNYKSAAGTAPSLDVPPDLTQLSRDSRYVVPGQTISANAMQTGQSSSAVASTPVAAPNAVGDARVMRDGECVFEARAMNDVVVNRGATSGMVQLRVEVDGRFVANQRADGMIIATPTGSSAYALSAGGPMLHPSLNGWVLVPIAPHTLSNRPIVLSDSAEITIELVAGRDASANFDMHSLASLLHGDRITVRRSRHSVRFLHPKGWSYFDTLRKKLHWNEGGS